MRYIDYLIKCIIRRLVSLIFNVKILVSILFILLVLVLSLYNKSYCAENDIFTVYNSINQDLLNRLDKGNTTKGFYNYINNVDYNFLVYYGTPSGSDMYNSTYNTSKINVAFYKTNSNLLDTETSNTKWAGVSQSIGKLANANLSSVNVFVFDEDGSYFQTGVDELFIPPSLFNYRSPVISEYLRNQKNVQDITNSITESTDKINDTINSTDYDESVVNIDTSSADIDDTSSTQLFTTIFTNFKNLLDNSNWQTVETINIPVPHSEQNLQLKSDILSNIVGNTFIATLINVAWYSVFGLYAFKFATKIFQSIKSGDILNGLNLSDEVITSSMM